jgi:hypothetical protein
MTEDEIRTYIDTAYPGVQITIALKENGAPEIAWGDTFFFYDPERRLAANRKFPFATIVTKDYPGFDETSNLSRTGVFRLNIGIGRETFQRLFGAGDRENDAAALDKLFPHPTYGKMHWVSILNPRSETFETLKPLLKEAYELAIRRL